MGGDQQAAASTRGGAHDETPRRLPAELPEPNRRVRVDITAGTSTTESPTWLEAAEGFVVVEGSSACQEQRAREDNSHGWIEANAEIFADSVYRVSMDENSLIVEGELYLNDPPVDGRFLGGALPDDVPLQSFTLITTCTE